jgi:DNA topoisomerase-1
MVIKQGKYGTFLACSGYPDCKNTVSLGSNGNETATGIDCPEKDCGGTLVQKKSRRGKIFYGCNRFPDCKFAIWDKPIPKECPQCGAKFMVEKTTKRDGSFISCLTKDCGYREKA